MEKYFKGLGNGWSFALLAIMVTCISTGAWMAWNMNILGAIPFLFGAYIATGFRELSPSPREIALITFLGKKTGTGVEGLTLVMPPIIGLVIFNARQFDHDFAIESVRCSDGVRVKGMISLSIKVDDSNPARLATYDDAGQFAGVIAQLDDILLSAIQQVAQSTGHDFKWMETNSVDIQGLLKTEIDRVDAASGLGIKVTKLKVKFTPINPKVIEANENQTIENLDRIAELLDTETINQQAEARLKMYRANGNAQIDIKACRDEVNFERLAAKGNVKIVQGGKLVNLGSVGNTDR